MKKILLLILPFFLLLSTVNAQNCTPDPNLPPDFLGVYPLTELAEPCDTIIPAAQAVIGEPYEFTFTAFAPAAFDYQGTEVTLSNVTINDVTGLPAGLSYVCEPADCIFLGDQAGCMKIVGTTTAAVGVYDLLIDATVNAALGPVPLPIPVTFPPSPDNNLLGLPTCPYKVQVVVEVANNDLFAEQVSVGQNNPNPFSGVTTIPVTVKEAGDYTFSVYNTVGELVSSRNMTLNGNENIEYDASNLDSGIYFYTLSNEVGSITKRMVVR